MITASRQRAGLAAIFAVVGLCGCAKRSTPVVEAHTAPAEAPASGAPVRATGAVQALQSFTVLAPQISGQNGRLTLVHLVANGASVSKGDTLAEFDAVQQYDAARDLEAKFDDLGHQVDQKRAQNRADAAKRL